MIRAALALAVLLGTAAAGPAETLRLELTLRTEGGRVALGEGIGFQLTFDNKGDLPFFIERPRGFGRDALLVVATRSDCRYESGPQYFDSDREFRTYRYVPLLPEDTLTVRLLPLNDPEAGGVPTIPIPGPGDYDFVVVFHSAGSDVEGPFLPIWRGTVTSSAIRLHVDEPNQEAVERRLAAAETCRSREDSPACQAAIDYFRYVSDERAAPVLRYLLSQAPYDSHLAEAVARQGSTADLRALEDAATSEALEASQRSYLRGLAAQTVARRTDRCSSPGS